MATGSPASLIVGMPEREIAVRLRVYDPGGAFSRQLAELWANAQEIILECAREHIAWLTLELDKAGSTTALEQTQRDALIQIGLDHIRAKYSSALDATWIDSICQQAFGAAQRGLSNATIVSMISRIARLVADRIQDRADLTEEVRRRMGDTVHQAAAYEIEVLLWQLGELRRQEAAHGRTQLAQAFNDLVARSLDRALANAHILSEEAARTAQSSRETLSDISDAADAATESAGTMRVAAKTAGGLGAAIDEVAAGLTRVLAIEERASRDTDAARAAADLLSKEIDAITSVVELIRSVAAQTNMLALNATIEAARAGDAGRGFSIVAQEVKSLASQTAHSTDQIADRIDAIHVASERSAAKAGEGHATMAEAREAIETIAATMRAQFEKVAAIAAAVDETAMTADNMCLLVGQVSTRTNSISADLERLSQIFSDITEELATLKARADDFVGTMGN